MTDEIKVTIDDRHASTWPQVRESLGLNPAGPDEIDGIEVVNVDKKDHFTESVTLRFENTEVLQKSIDRLFNRANEMFEYGIQSDAEDVQDFAMYALPQPQEVTDE